MAIKAFSYRDPNAFGRPTNDMSVGDWVLASGDVGEAVKWCEYSDRTVQFLGTFDGATITMRGSNLSNPDPATPADWFTVSDNKSPNGLEAVTGPSGSVIYDNPLWLSPIATGGTATALTIALNGRK